MTNQQKPGFSDAVITRALAHFAAINGWRLNGRTLERSAHHELISAMPLASLTSFVSPVGGPSDVHFLAASEFPHGAPLANNAVPHQAERSFDEFRKALDNDGAVILAWRGSKIEFDVFQRRHVQEWLTLTGLRVQHELWVHGAYGHLWLTGTADSIHSPDRAEQCIAALIRRYGSLEATVTLTQFQDYPRQDLPRTPQLSSWKRATVKVEVKASTPNRAELTVIDFVTALRKATAEAPRGFVGISHFRERYFPTPGGKAQFDALLSSAVQGSLVEVSRQPDGAQGVMVATLSLVERAGESNDD